jgi:hypothetical protein
VEDEVAVAGFLGDDGEPDVGRRCVVTILVGGGGVAVGGRFADGLP